MQILLQTSDLLAQLNVIHPAQEQKEHTHIWKYRKCRTSHSALKGRKDLKLYGKMKFKHRKIHIDVLIHTGDDTIFSEEKSLWCLWARELSLSLCLYHTLSLSMALQTQWIITDTEVGWEITESESTHVTQHHCKCLFLGEHTNRHSLGQTHTYTHHTHSSSAGRATSPFLIYLSYRKLSKDMYVEKWPWWGLEWCALTKRKHTIYLFVCQKLGEMCFRSWLALSYPSTSSLSFTHPFCLTLACHPTHATHHIPPAVWAPSFRGVDE